MLTSKASCWKLITETNVDFHNQINTSLSSKLTIVYSYFFSLLFLTMSCYIHKLPLHMLEQNLSFLVKDINNLDDWMAVHPLLNVCRLWYKILRLILFKTAFISCPNSGKKGAYSKCPNNIELIRARNCIPLIKSIKFNLECPYTNIVANILEIIQPSTTDWSSVQLINIALHTDLYYGDSAPPSIDQLTHLAYCLISSMPNVIDLTIDDDLRENTKYFSQAFVDHYAVQLKRLALNMPLITCKPYLNPQLTYLKFDCTKSTLPQIFSSSLKHLELKSLTSAFPWSIFYNNSTSKITFKSLTTLSIWFSEDTQATLKHSSYQLCFPSLQELELVNCQYNNDILSADFGTAKLKSALLSGNMDHILLYYNLGIKSQSFQIILINNPITNDQANAIFGINGYNNKELCINESLCKLIPLNGSWAHLNSLQIFSTIDFSVFIQTIVSVPWLERLVVTSICFEYVSKEDIDSILYTNIDRDLRDICLRYLLIFTDSGSPDELFIYAINSLVSRLYMLEYIWVPKTYINDIYRLIRNRKDSQRIFNMCIFQS